MTEYTFSKYKNLCNVNFESQYAYINKKAIHITDYLKQLEKKPKSCKSKLYCLKNHELICVNGKKNRAHFRHKNIGDMGGQPMTMWHCEWQSHFPITEICYHKKNKQIKLRRADAVIDEYNLIIEFQNSKICREAVKNRKSDYNMHNMKINWIINGNFTINVKKLEHSNRVYLEFISEYWKYKSFLDYPSIYIDINSEIYKLNPNKIKSNMIDVLPAKSKKEFIHALKNGIELWKNDEPYQCNLFTKQQGAGNGKTYGIIQMLEKDGYEHYTNFILVTKQHSAKYVIYTEFQKQIKNNQLHHLKLETNTLENAKKGKKFIIKYKNKKTGLECQLIIATIDSLMYALGNKDHNELRFFEGIINSIIDNDTKAKINNASLNFGGINQKLNKETLLVIDETQDLTDNYSKAILQIMRNRYIDTYVVGDKLQSISYENNAFTYFINNDFSYIKKFNDLAINKCRRFNNPELINFVNTIVPFDKYQLPSILPSIKFIPSDNSNVIQYQHPITIFQGNCIYSSDASDKDKINIEVEKIMEHFKKAVDTYNYLPEDFLIITPFTHKNPLVDAIQLSINIYWNKKISTDLNYINNVLKNHNYWKSCINNTDNYYNYAVFHKSELGNSINLKDSEYSTRIVSIHSSKGDGRKAVFVIGICESSLKKFSNNDNLIYDSLIHVAFTRMKERLYIRMLNNGDDISDKLNKYILDNNLSNYNIKPNLDIFNNIKYGKIIESLKTKENYKILEKDIINYAQLENLCDIKDEKKKIIDMGHHNIRYYALFINIILKILHYENNNKDSKLKRQLYAILKDVCEASILKAKNWRDYNRYLHHNSNKSDKCITILKISDKGRDYRIYYNILYDFIINIKKKINKKINDRKKIKLCPFESIILYYMLQICHQGIHTDIHINDIYNIINIYSKCDILSHDKHNNCLCTKHFCNTNKILKNKNIDDMQLYIKKHYENINKINDILNTFSKKYPYINWLINHPITFEGNNTNFKISKKFQLLGYNNNTIVICYIKPQFNKLNYNEIKMTSIYDTFLLNNIKKYNDSNILTENYKKFNNKKIITAVFTLDKDQPYYFNWMNKLNENLIIKNNALIKNHLQKYLYLYYKNSNRYIYIFYKYWKDNCPKEHRTSIKFVTLLQNKYYELKNKNETKYKKFPTYISEFINYIKFQIENEYIRSKQKGIINFYRDKDNFLEQVDKKLIKSIDSYLGLEKVEERNECEEEDIW